MTTYPILFSTPMVLAILEGRKTMTRIIVKPNPRISSDPSRVGEVIKALCMYDACPYGHQGDVLWVKETCCKWPDTKAKVCSTNGYVYKTQTHCDPYGWEITMKEMGIKWKPSIYMPKDACRIFLKITDIHVERLQDITVEDTVKEGIDVFADIITLADFAALWAKINGPDSWDSNPWVWVISFERCEKPENF